MHLSSLNAIVLSLFSFFFLSLSLSPSLVLSLSVIVFECLSYIRMHAFCSFWCCDTKRYWCRSSSGNTQQIPAFHQTVCLNKRGWCKRLIWLLTCVLLDSIVCPFVDSVIFFFSFLLFLFVGCAPLCWENDWMKGMFLSTYNGMMRIVCGSYTFVILSDLAFSSPISHIPRDAPYSIKRQPEGKKV